MNTYTLLKSKFKRRDLNILATIWLRFLEKIGYFTENSS